MTNHLCGLCIDNGAMHTLEVVTTHGTTDAVTICLSCIHKRITEELIPELHPERRQRIVSFTVTKL